MTKWGSERRPSGDEEGLPWKLEIPCWILVILPSFTDSPGRREFPMTGSPSLPRLKRAGLLELGEAGFNGKPDQLRLLMNA